MEGLQTWVINLDRAPERLARIRAQLQRLEAGEDWKPQQRRHEVVACHEDSVGRFALEVQRRGALYPPSPFLRGDEDAGGADLTFATHLAAGSRSECQIQSSTRSYTC